MPARLFLVSWWHSDRRPQFQFVIPELVCYKWFALWDRWTLDTSDWTFKTKRGCEPSNWRHQKKRSLIVCMDIQCKVLCLSGIPLKQKMANHAKNGGITKKNTSINLARKTTTSKWRSHVHPEHQATMWSTNPAPNDPPISEIPNSLGAPETVETQQTADGYSNCFQVEKILKQNAALHSVLEFRIDFCSKLVSISSAYMWSLHTPIF